MPQESIRTLPAILALVLVGSFLRLSGLAETGVIYPDDLRAYSGLEIVEEFHAENIPLIEKLENVYTVSIKGTGARPLLAWFSSIPAFFGRSAIGFLYLPFALVGIFSIFLVWVLCRRWFDPYSALIAAAWIAVSGLHVDFSRSALPPSPGIFFFLLGLVLLSGNRDFPVTKSGIRYASGAVFLSIGVLFHPAYPVYLVVPVSLIVAHGLRGDAATRASGRVTARNILILFVPMVLIIILYDLPSGIRSLVNGDFKPGSLGYLKGLWTMFQSKTSREGTNEGVFFWLYYLIRNMSWPAVSILGIALIGALVRAIRSCYRAPWYILAAWIVVPSVLFGLTSFTSFGRLSAPLLIPTSMIVGTGLEYLRKYLDRILRIPSWISVTVFVAIVVAIQMPYSMNVLSHPSREPQLNTIARKHGIGEAMGFPRTDVRSLPDLNVVQVYAEKDIKEYVCSADGSSYLILSAAPIHLLYRHYDFLFDYLDLQPVWTYPNPYTVLPRLSESVVNSRKDRERMKTDDHLRRLGLFRVSDSVCRI